VEWISVSRANTRCRSSYPKLLIDTPQIDTHLSKNPPKKQRGYL
jgi:hypothetical protein